jgi:hypothetical protein
MLCPALNLMMEAVSTSEHPRWESSSLNLQVFRSHATHSWHNVNFPPPKEKKTEDGLVVTLENVQHAQWCMHSHFLQCFMQPSEEFLQWKKLLSSRDIVNLSGTGLGTHPHTHPGKLNNNEMPVSVQQWTSVALEKKTFFHSDCSNTTGRPAQADYNMNMTCGLLYSHSDIVFIDPIELYWIATINKYFNMRCVTFQTLCILVFQFFCCSTSWECTLAHMCWWRQK